MDVQIITDHQIWNNFVGTSACCNVTQSYEWGELAHYLGCSESLRVGIVNNAGQLCAAMLVLVMRAPLLNKTYFMLHGVLLSMILMDQHSPCC